jgi:hypothetical protein
MRELLKLQKANNSLVFCTGEGVFVPAATVGKYLCDKVKPEVLGCSEGDALVYLTVEELKIVLAALQTCGTSKSLPRLEQRLTMGEVDAALDDPSVIKNILGDYKGPFNLGVVQTREGCYVSIRVPKINHEFPTSISYNGRTIPVHVDLGYKPRAERR